MKCKFAKDLQQQAMKKTLDGMIDILSRMYEAQNEYKTFMDFCHYVKGLNHQQFYELPIAKK